MTSLVLLQTRNRDHERGICSIQTRVDRASGRSNCGPIKMYRVRWDR